MSSVVETTDTVCGCGAAPAIAPVPIDNRPGLSAIQYRTGTWGTFRAAMIAALSQSQLPQLAELSTRDPSDFSIALLDAFACAADVLTFYQERNANEAYLRTAVERMSVGFLAGLIGYVPRPGVAASTLLAFNLDTAPGAPPTTTIPVGTQVQSVPGAGQTSQTFETTQVIEARPAWNALKPITVELDIPGKGDGSIYLQGTSTNLKPGDGVLMVGGEREAFPTSTAWDFRRVASTTADTANGRTLVVFDHPLGGGAAQPASIAVRFFAFRQRAALWGNNAMDRQLANAALPSNKPATWAADPLSADPSDPNAATIQLDAVYPQIAPNVGGSSIASWIVVSQVASQSNEGDSSPPPITLPAYTELYSVTSVAEQSLTRFLMSGKCTTLGLSGPNIGKFAPRFAALFVQSDELAIGPGPYVSADKALPSYGLSLQSSMPSPLEGSSILLSQFVDGLSEGQALVFTGKRVHLQLAYKVKAGTLSLVPPGPSPTPFELTYMQVLEVMAPPVQQSGSVRISARTLDGHTGVLTATPDQFTLVPAPATAQAVSEVATLVEAQSATDPKDGQSATTLQLEGELQYSYDRSTVTICANVAPATHGATVHEVLGNGDGTQPFQSFVLKQTPLTFVSAASATGAASTLVVTVNGVTWQGQDALYGQGPTSRVYVTEIADDATATVEFGDGNEGARLPTGSQNVLASYRIGLGTVGNLGAGQLSLLASRPLGVQSVTNPVAAAGGGDPELLVDARANAGLTIQTLGRVVSLPDYESFANAFAGVGKASAAWVWDGVRRSVLLTLAAADGSLVDPTGAMAQNLVTALAAAGDPWVPVIPVSYSSVAFRLGLVVTVTPDHAASSSDVLASVEAALRAAFSFRQRAFAQHVTFSEVITVAQQVAGVLAVTITSLYRPDKKPTTSPPIVMRIPSFPAQPPAGNTTAALGAELLTLDPGPLLELSVTT